MNIFMKRAVSLAVENVQEGGQPFGAVVVYRDEIVAEGVNTLHKIYDTSGHAELLAIRQLQQQLQTNDLSGHTMYASGEPCEMCLTAMYFTGIRKIYYCTSLTEAIGEGFEASEVMTDTDLKKIKKLMIHLPLSNNIESPIKLWKKQGSGLN